MSKYEIIITGSRIQYGVQRKTTRFTIITITFLAFWELRPVTEAGKKLTAKVVSYRRDERPVKVRDHLP